MATQQPQQLNTLTQKNVTKTLLRMALPMLAGTFAMNAYNLTDTWFVSRLGTTSLAAMSFTFPVVMILRFVTMGLGTGALTLVGHALGRGDRDTSARLTTHALLLSLLLSLIITLAGFLTLQPLFTLLGASGEVLTQACQYMAIWYGGAVVMAVPSIMGQILMGTGDTRSASISMVTGTLINLILDPLLIFGAWGIPAMGITGAALATIVSQLFSLFFPLYVLSRKHRLIDWNVPRLKRLLDSWRNILKLGIPSVLNNLLTPLSMAVITRLIAGYGAFAVAAIGATSRLELFAFMVPMSIGMSLVPFVSQNYGAAAFDRILQAQRETRLFALIYGAGATLLFFVFAPQMAGLFSEDPAVVTVMVEYLRISCFGYGLLEAFRYSSFCLTGVQKPLSSALLTLVRTLVLLVPLSYLGSWWWGLTGIFVARLVTDVLSSTVAMSYSRRVILTMQRRENRG